MLQERWPYFHPHPDSLGLALSSGQTRMLPLRHCDLPGETEVESWPKQEQSGRLPGNSGAVAKGPPTSVHVVRGLRSGGVWPARSAVLAEAGP